MKPTTELADRLNKQVTTKFELLTVKDMEAIILATYEAQDKGKIKQRSQKPRVVAKYARDIKNNDWEPNPQPVILTTQGWAIDGLHRLLAGVDAKSPMVFNVTRNWSDVKTFKVVDTGTPRSVAQLMAMEGQKYSGRRVGVARNILQIAIAGELHQQLSIAEVQHILDEVEKSFNWLLELLHETQTPIIAYSTEVYAPIIWYHTVSPGLASSFAESFFKLDFAHGNATWALKKYLDKNPARGARGRLLRVTANAIEAWRSKEQLAYIKPSQDSLEWLSKQNMDLKKKISSIVGGQ